MNDARYASTTDKSSSNNNNTNDSQITTSNNLKCSSFLGGPVTCITFLTVNMPRQQDTDTKDDDRVVSFALVYGQ
eukprot:scaffold9102_cov78-Amphora_coffeaeformis.AAC.1